MNGDRAPRTPNPLPPATTRRGFLTGAAATGLTWATASTAHADGHPLCLSRSCNGATGL
ncbi:twin-arginine translocation signal domain-containing protein [Streptomyces californicus]|uniref:twin-arginine translocation signal domain-containing protein n=1 Tax=Streptomyces californicus TaxID=67351 RepID=UPI0036C674B6